VVTVCQKAPSTRRCIKTSASLRQESNSQSESTQHHKMH